MRPKIWENMLWTSKIYYFTRSLAAIYETLEFHGFFLEVCWNFRKVRVKNYENIACAFVIRCGVDENLIVNNLFLLQNCHGHLPVLIIHVSARHYSVTITTKPSWHFYARTKTDMENDVRCRVLINILSGLSLLNIRFTFLLQQRRCIYSSLSRLKTFLNSSATGKAGTEGYGEEWGKSRHHGHKNDCRQNRFFLQLHSWICNCVFCVQLVLIFYTCLLHHDLFSTRWEYCVFKHHGTWHILLSLRSLQCSRLVPHRQRRSGWEVGFIVFEYKIHQGCNEVRWCPGQEASLALPCSNLSSFWSKFTGTLKKVLVTLLVLSGGPRSHSKPHAVIRCRIVIQRPGNCSPLAALVTSLLNTIPF